MMKPSGINKTKGELIGLIDFNAKRFARQDFLNEAKNGNRAGNGRNGYLSARRAKVSGFLPILIRR